jgi:hypothetical protein
MYGLGAEMMGPPVDPNQPVAAPDVQQQIADVWSYLWEGPGAAPRESIAPRQLISGIQNSTLAIGAGVVVLGIAFLKGRR